MKFEALQTLTMGAGARVRLSREQLARCAGLLTPATDGTWWEVNIPFQLLPGERFEFHGELPAHQAAPLELDLQPAAAMVEVPAVAAVIEAPALQPSLPAAAAAKKTGKHKA